MLKPKNTKYKKLQKGRLSTKKIIKMSFNHYNYILLAKEKKILKINQIEAIYKLIKKKIKKTGQIHINIFPQLPITKKATGIRMGKGKGNVDTFIVKVKEGQVLFKIKFFGKFFNLKKNLIFLRSLKNKFSLKLNILYNK